MRLVTVAGPPSCGKTSIVSKACAALQETGATSAVVKFDCLQGRDDELYAAAGIPVTVALSGGLSNWTSTSPQPGRGLRLGQGQRRLLRDRDGRAVQPAAPRICAGRWPCA